MASTSATPTPPAFTLFESLIEELFPTNISFPLSYERTKIQELPFPHPKFHARPSTGEIYETSSPIADEYDPACAYIDGEEKQNVDVEVEEVALEVDEDTDERERVRQSIETNEGSRAIFTMLAGDVVRDAAAHDSLPHQVNHDTVVEGRNLNWGKWEEIGSGFGDSSGWERIEWPDKSEREAVTQEAKRSRDGPVEGEVGVRRDKRVRERR